MRIKIAIILITAVIAVLLCFLPYKETWSNRAFVFGKSNRTSLGYTCVKHDFIRFGISERFHYLIVFFPVLITFEILLAGRISSTGWRIVFIFHGLLGLFILFWAAALIFFWDWWFFERKAGYYIFLTWVIAYCLLSILAGMPKLNELVLRVRNRLTKQWAWEVMTTPFACILSELLALLVSHVERKVTSMILCFFALSQNRMA